MQHVAVQAYIRDLSWGQRIELFNCPLDKGLHQVMIHIRHDLFAKQETHRDEVSIEVRFLHVGLDIFHRLFENGKLRYPDCTLIRCSPFHIKNYH